MFLKSDCCLASSINVVFGNVSIHGGILKSIKNVVYIEGVRNFLQKFRTPYCYFDNLVFSVKGKSVVIFYIHASICMPTAGMCGIVNSFYINTGCKSGNTDAQGTVGATVSSLTEEPSGTIRYDIYVREILNDQFFVIVKQIAATMDFSLIHQSVLLRLIFCSFARDKFS